METNLTAAPTKLAAGGILRICNARVERIVVVHGTVWVTQEGDQRDIFLSDGQDFVFDRAGTALVEAITDTHLLPLFGEFEKTLPTDSSRVRVPDASMNRGVRT